MSLEIEKVRETFLEITNGDYSEGGIVSFRHVIPNIDLTNEGDFPDQRLEQLIRIIMREVDETVTNKLRYHGNRLLFPKYYIDVGEEPEIGSQVIYLVAVVYDFSDSLDGWIPGKVPDLALKSGSIVGWECPSCESIERMYFDSCRECDTKRATILGEDNNEGPYYEG